MASTGNDSGTPSARGKSKVVPAVRQVLNTTKIRLLNILHEDLRLEFRDETTERGAAVIRVTLKTDDFENWTEEDRRLGGQCFFITTKFAVSTFAEVDEMFKKMTLLIDAMNKIF